MKVEAALDSGQVTSLSFQNFFLSSSERFLFLEASYVPRLISLKIVPIEVSSLAGANKNINANLAFSRLAQNKTGTTSWSTASQNPEQGGMSYNSMY